MILSPKIVARLQSGRAVATTLTPPQPDLCAYLLILPRVPHRHTDSEHWLTSGTGEPWLRDPNDITEFEIRYIHHHATYTDEEWGLDYDHVLADPTTRVKRRFVQTLEEVEAALATWSTSHLSFQHPHMFDSSLVSSPIESYLEHGDLYEHLSQP